MPSFETEIMQSFVLARDVIRDTITNNVVALVNRGEISLDKRDLEKLFRIISASAEQGGINSMKQIQSVINKKR